MNHFLKRDNLEDINTDENGKSKRKPLYIKGFLIIKVIHKLFLIFHYESLYKKGQLKGY